MKKLLHTTICCLPTARLLLALVALAFGFSAHAQVSFSNPVNGSGATHEFTVYNSPVNDNSRAVQVPAPGDGELTANFSVTLYRPIGTNTQGYVAIHLGTSANSLVTPDLTVAERPVVNNSLWTSVAGSGGAASEQLIVTGTFTLSGNLVGNNTGLYASYIDNTAPPVTSNPVLLSVLPLDPIKNPILDFYACGNPGNTICGDQCVPYGTRPSIIKGRVMARYSPEYTSYQGLCAQLGIPVWAEQSEDELVVWQYSYDNVNWTGMGFGGSSFQPSVCTRTTYYRRESTHMVSDWWWGRSREWWYTSNVVKITPTAPAPTTNQSTVKSCGGSVTVGANTHQAIRSYNWWVPYAGWTISDGVQAPFSTHNNQSSFVTSRNSNIVIYPPSNAAPGNYVISFSANGECGGQSEDAQLTITIDYTPTNSPINGYFTLAGGSTSCNPRYNLRTSQVSGATSYEATLSNGAWAQGQINPTTNEVSFFILSGAQYNLSAQIFAIGPCGRSLAYDVPAQDLFLRQQDLASVRPCDATPIEDYFQAYPNPATETLTIQAKSDGAIGYLYNSHGEMLRTIRLEKSDASKVLDTSGLPKGLYNLVVEDPSHERHMLHIVIEH